jgi:hypothetical protein
MRELKTRRDREREEVPALPRSWFDRASEAAKRFKVSEPQEIPTQAEVERRLREIEQEDGE